MKRQIFHIIICAVVLFTSCGKREAKDVVDELPNIFPDYIDVTVPHAIAPLNFEVKDATYLKVMFTNGNGMSVQADGNGSIAIDEQEWKALLADGGDLRVDVSAWTDEHPEGASYQPFTIYVSKDEIDPYVVYRLIPPGYEGWKQMGIYERTLANFEEQMLVDNSDNEQHCMNCHTSNNGDAATYVYHLRGEQGTTIIHHDGIDERIDLRRLTGGLHGSHPAWHPSGRYIAFSSNDTKQVFYGRSRDKIEAFDTKSDLFIYDVRNKRAILDERFTDSLHWETYPTFSPDGKWLYFSMARPVHMPEQAPQLQYDLVRVPFDETDGKLGDRVDTLYSTALRGGTALMPRLSPDGQFILYTVSQFGAFNLYHKEADFEMMRISHVSGEAADNSVEDVDIQYVDCSPINSCDSESYHAWSSNGRWMLFSSKRIDGRYTRLFIAHWDGKEWAKPFLLPQQDPEQNTLLMMAYNVAEFRR